MKKVSGFGRNTKREIAVAFAAIAVLAVEAVGQVLPLK